MVSISGITSGIKTFARYGKRFLNTTPELVFGTGAEAAGTAMRNASGSLFDKAGAGWRALEANGKGSFFKSFIGNFKTFLPDMKGFIKEGTEGLTGLAKLKGGTKGLFKGISKKMPFIGAVMMMAFELPNIWKATKEQGIMAGLKETVKSGARLVGGGLGSAIGSAICPGIGSLVGWVAGEWLAGKIVGKSYSEKKAEAEEQLAQVQQAQEQQGAAMAQVPQAAAPTQNPYSNYNPYMYSSFNNPYKDDIYMNQLPFNAIA